VQFLWRDISLGPMKAVKMIDDKSSYRKLALFLRADRRMKSAYSRISPFIDNGTVVDTLTLSFRYSEQQYARAVRTHYASRLRLPLDILVTIALVVGGVYELRSGSQSFGIFLLSAAGVFTLILIAAFVVIPKLAFRQPTLREHYSLTFSPEGIHFQTTDIDSQLQWKMYSHALIDKESFLLYYGSNQFTVIPKSAFQTAAEREAFERLLADKVSKVVNKSA
jgi:hypothetical protein